MRSLAMSVLAFLAVINTSIHTTDRKRIVCYFTNWAQYRHGKAKFVPENIDASLCTHYVYAFVGLSFVPGTNEVELVALEWNDESTGDFTGMYERFQTVGQSYVHTKTLVSIDGWNSYSLYFGKLTSSETIRERFVQRVISFLRKHRFDGLDLHWKYPLTSKTEEKTRDMFALIVQLLQSAFTKERRLPGKPKLLLIVSANPQFDVLGHRPIVNLICRNVDFLNVITYDFHGPWEKVTGHISPLYPKTLSENSVAGEMKKWQSKDCPKEKLNLGLAFYGRSFTLTSNETGLKAPAFSGRRGLYTQTEGFLAHYEICRLLKTPHSERFTVEEHVNYIVSGNQWVGFEDAESIRIKVCFAIVHHYGGVMIWAVDLDDFNGEFCDRGKWPLLKTVKDQMDHGSSCPPVYK